MYYSLTIGDDNNTINTFDDWYIVPTSRPSFSPPSFDMKTIDIPGRNGLLDVTTSLTKFPTFGNRTGTLEFLIHPDSKMTWYETYSKVANYLHGQTKRVSLEDDSAFWYEGRFWLNDFKSGDHYSTITINYSLEPYKKSKWTTLEDWDENPFNLPSGQYISQWFKELSCTRTDVFISVFSSGNIASKYRQDILGSALFTPTLIIKSDDGKGLNIRFYNDELGISYETHMNDGSNVDHNIIFSPQHTNVGLRILVQGIGKLSVEYNVRSL